MKITIAATLLLAAIAVFAQNQEAFESGSEEEKSSSPLDPSRFSVRHSVSFGAMSGMGSTSGLKSQSLYTTMMQYQFAAPVTLNLNFSLPIHSTFSPAQNLTGANLQSLDYFKSMPFDVSLNWQPTSNTRFQFSVANYSSYGYFSPYYGGGYGGYHPWRSPGRQDLLP